MKPDMKQLLLDMSALEWKEFRHARYVLGDALDPEESADSDLNTRRNTSEKYQSVEKRILELENHVSTNREYMKPKWLLFAALVDRCPTDNAERYFWALSEIFDPYIPQEDAAIWEFKTYGDDVAETAMLAKKLFDRDAENE